MLDYGLTTPLRHRTLSPIKIWRYGSRYEQIGLFGLWLILLAASIGLGLASVIWSWSGLPISFGGVVVYITVYPPLLICLLLTLTCGWWWGAIPAYLATLSLALYAGMPPLWAALFACANPLGFAIMVIGYHAIAGRRNLRDPNALLFYVQLSFVASIFSSSGALIWCYTNHVDTIALLPIWQGWWLGSFLQSVFIVGPLLALLWPRIERWQNSRPELLSLTSTDSRHSVLRLLISVSAGVLTYGFVTIQLASKQLETAIANSRSPLTQAVVVMQQTTWVFFWVFALIVLFIAFFGYQLFTQWQRSSDQLLAELHQANLDLEMLAQTDGLTGLLNRRAINEHLRAEWQRSSRMNQGAALVMLDIDHFKAINDQHGHQAGDAALRCLSKTIGSVSRDMDIAGRYGGEEFLIILPQTDAHGAWIFAERLRERVATEVIRHDTDAFHVHISLGVAMFSTDDGCYEDWLERADQALYRAKHNGRNQTVIAT